MFVNGVFILKCCEEEVVKVPLRKFDVCVYYKEESIVVSWVERFHKTHGDLVCG